jgi:hypothetical protein
MRVRLSQDQGRGGSKPYANPAIPKDNAEALSKFTSEELRAEISRRDNDGIVDI